jgi:hypothetical protein
MKDHSNTPSDTKTETAMRSENSKESLEQFIKRNRITATIEWADSNPDMTASDEWSRSASHYKITLRCQKKRMTAYFSQGCAITREPTATDLLTCLADDVAGLENAQDFEDWASEYGYDSDSRRAEKTYRVIEKQRAKLQVFLPAGQLEVLLWNTKSRGSR